MQDKKRSHPERQFGMASLGSGDPTNLKQRNFTTSLKSLQSEVDRKFTPKREKSDQLGEVFDYLGEKNRSIRVRQCGTFLEFVVSADAAKLHAANFCKDRFCAMCNWRRSLKIFSQVSQCMDYVSKQKKYKFLFLTLTLRNCTAEDFPKTVQQFYDGWRWLYHKSARFRKVVQGSFRSLEVTYNPKTNTFHPHLHIILVVPSDYFVTGYIKQDEWVQLWKQACSLDYDPIVDVRKFKSRSGEDLTEDELTKAVAESAKYAVKDNEYLSDDMERNAFVLRTLMSGLSGRRLVSFTGCLLQARKALSLDDAEDGDLIHLELDQIREDVATIIVRYKWKSGFYIREVSSQ